MERAVLLIHGFLSDENDFAAIIPELHQYYQKVLTVKIPGHGDEIGVVPFTVDGCFKVIIDAFDSLKDYQSIDVIGYSMGGALATYLAEIRDFHKLVLLAPANKYINFKYLFKRAKVYRELRRQLKTDKENSQVYQDRIIRLKSDHEFLKTMVRERMHFHKYLPKYYLCFRKIIKKVNREVKEIKNPCLIIWGEMDYLVPSSSIDYIRKLCTNEVVSVIELEDITHLLLLSPINANIVITKIIEFLREEE